MQQKRGFCLVLISSDEEVRKVMRNLIAKLSER